MDTNWQLDDLSGEDRENVCLDNIAVEELKKITLCSMDRLTITYEEFLRLNEISTLTDMLLDFGTYMKVHEEKATNCNYHIFSTYFFTNLKKDGYEVAYIACKSSGKLSKLRVAVGNFLKCAPPYITVQSHVQPEM